jgi:CheY-like chemotaxis protein
MKTVVVAEDRESSREMIRALLEHSGFAVIEASNGAEAVRLVRESVPDLVLLDLQMPVMDGFHALRELRAEERFQNLPVAAVTANAMAGDKERALAIGFNGYFAKPLDFAAFRRELARLVPA